MCGAAPGISSSKADMPTVSNMPAHSAAAKAVEAGEKALAEGRDVELPPDVPPELLSQLNIKQSVSAIEDPEDQGQTTVRKINIVLDKGAARPTPGSLRFGTQLAAQGQEAIHRIRTHA